jgi:hypothetical protein
LEKSVFRKIKNSKPFSLVDLLVYAALLIIIAVLFLSFVVFPKTKVSDGFTIEVKGTVVLTYYFKNDEYFITPKYTELVEITETESGIFFKVYQPAKTKHNVVYFDFNEKSAKVTESNCSTSADCTHSPAIIKSGAIVCVPNNLVVSPLSGGNSNLPIVG